DAVLHHLADRIEELVDRRADRDDHRSIGGDVARRGREDELVALERPDQHLLAAMLDERQPAGLQRLERLAITVLNVDAKTGLGKGQHQRDADAPAAADDGEVGITDLRRRTRDRLGTGKIHALPLDLPGDLQMSPSKQVIAQAADLYKGPHSSLVIAPCHSSL